ncbi:hypothetical protein CRYUN_Cryun40dG0067900 [Craigia yunnanensis]
MVLRSKREHLSSDKEQEMEIAELKLLLQDKNRELQELVEKQGSELTQAKQLIPTLQRQVTSFTGQLQCLAQDLAQKMGNGSWRQCLQRS